MVRNARSLERKSGKFMEEREGGRDLVRETHQSVAIAVICFVDDPDQGDVREIEPFCDHLRADQNIDLLLGKCL